MVNAYINQNARCHDDADYRVRRVRETAYLVERPMLTKN